MLERVELTFQRHVRRAVELDPLVTCVVGPTDSGKSSFIRGLRWLFFNQPTGEALTRMRIVPEGTDFAKVALWLDGDRCVTRRKGPKGNQYVLDGKPMNRDLGTGAAVPQEVATLLNLSAASVQLQHDRPYWFSDTAGAVSRALNSIVDLEAIDRTLGNAGAAVRTARATVEAVRERLAGAEQRAAGLVWVVQRDQLLRRAEAAAAVLATQRRLCAQAHELLQDGKRHVLVRQHAAQRGLGVANGMAAAKAALAAGERLAAMRALLQKGKELQQQTVIRRAELAPTKAAVLRAEQVGQQCKQLRAALANLAACQANTHTLRQQAQADRQAANRARQTLRTCPTCGQSLKS